MIETHTLHRISFTRGIGQGEYEDDLCFSVDVLADSDHDASASAQQYAKEVREIDTTGANVTCQLIRQSTVVMGADVIERLRSED